MTLPEELSCNIQSLVMADQQRSLMVMRRESRLLPDLCAAKKMSRSARSGISRRLNSLPIARALSERKNSPHGFPWAPIWRGLQKARSAIVARKAKKIGFLHHRLQPYVSDRRRALQKGNVVPMNNSARLTIFFTYRRLA